MRLGFIGLGSIGMPMALNFFKGGHTLVVHDIDRGRGDRFVSEGAHWARSPKDVAASCDILFTSLPGPRQVEQVITGPDGAINGLARGSLWVDLTTSDIAVTQKLSDLLFARGVISLDAPITGGIAKAYEGTITIYVSGEKRAYERVRPVLKLTAEHVPYLGALGNATIVKLITNALAMAHVIALGEGLVLGKKLGIDEKVLLEAIKVSYADSFVARIDGPDILSGDYGTSFAAALACKDLVLSLDLAREHGIELPAIRLTHDLYQAARAEFGDSSAANNAVRQLERRSGVSLSGQQ